jgi:hypothetical protein
MRLTWVAVYSILLFGLYACERENTIAEMKAETRQKLMGRWQLEKKLVELFDPFPTLKSETVYVGTTEDFYHFKENDAVSCGEAGKPVKEETVSINVSSVIITPLAHSWSIDSLKSNRLILSCLVRHDEISDKTRRETLYFRR